MASVYAVGQIANGKVWVFEDVLLGQHFLNFHGKQFLLFWGETTARILLALRGRGCTLALQNNTQHSQPKGHQQ